MDKTGNTAKCNDTTGRASRDGASAPSAIVPTCQVLPTPDAAHFPVRAGSILLDAEGWLPGDVLLFKGRAGNMVHRAIMRGQAAYGDAAGWVHAALCIGRGWLLEAVHQPLGAREVVETSLTACSPYRPAQVGRVTGLTHSMRDTLIANARKMRGWPYSISRALGSGFQVLGNHLDEADQLASRLGQAPRGVICSGVIDIAFVSIGIALATGRSARTGPILRAMLVVSTQIVWVPVATCRVG